MSHFSVMVIGDNAEGQLERYDESIAVEKYLYAKVSEEWKQQVLDHYLKKGHVLNSFDECYEQFGEDWDGNRCKKDENGEWQEYSTYNPDSKWDWYVLGGRWSGCYITKLKSGAQGVVGESGAGGNTTGIDQALKGEIDFDAIRKENFENALKSYHEVEKKCGGSIPKLQFFWKELVNNPEYANLTIDEKRQKYHAQESVKLWAKAGFHDMFDLELADFQCTAEEYAQRAMEATFATYAYVIDGEWYERGQMGWWGISTNEMDTDDWNKQVQKMLDELPNDTLISIYDCHI